ncbi:hypothetical protein F444_05645 [Phytophthora nicotianae P1976]|uniref:Uncharacterized protein n=1 Tax=Phytophthora nicotianae P1976 TaxID=1317066 RepID=A0A081ALG7_PHYNI|nr:hypothetical protein F444_05645 [Phytophthora nicotianae P1976]
MDRRRSHRGRSRSPRRRTPERIHRRRNRSPSRSSRSRSVVERAPQSWGTSKAWATRDRHREHYIHSPSASPQRHLYQRERNFTSNARSYTNRRSRSRSIDTSRSRDSRRDSRYRRSSSPRRRVSHTRQRSPSLRRQSPSPPRYKKYVSRQRSRSPYRRSPSPHRRSPTPPRRSPSPRRQYSPSPRRRSPSPRQRSFSPRERSASPRCRSTSVRRRSPSPRRDRASRSRSDSRWCRIEDAASQSGSPRGPSSSRTNDTRAMNPPVAKQSPMSSASTPPKAKTGQFNDSKNDVKHDVKEATMLEDRSADEQRLSATGSHDGRSNSYGYSHQHLHSRRPFHPDARAPSSSPAPLGLSTPAKSVTISDQVTTSSPRVDPSSTSTPTRPADGNRNHHVVVNPILEKMREAQRESHRAYLKSNSDYNRAEMKYVSIEAELRLAEFWLEVVTKNLEDVGKRIEVHDWNFQKITNQDGADIA